MPNEFKTPEEVFGKGLMADIADFFLVDELSDLLKFTPGGFAGGPGARGALAGVVNQGARAVRSPGASLLGRMFGQRASDATAGMGGMFAKIERALAEANKAPKPGPMNPRNPADAAEMLKRRIEVDPTSRQRAAEGAGVAVLTSEKGQEFGDNIQDILGDLIENERRRTNGQGLRNFFGTK